MLERLVRNSCDFISINFTVLDISILTFMNSEHEDSKREKILEEIYEAETTFRNNIVKRVFANFSV